MKKLVAGSTIILALLCAVAWAADDDDQPVPFEGRYVGQGYIYDEQDRLAKTDLRMDVKLKEDGLYRVEFSYFQNAVATFAKVKADGVYRLVVDESVGAPGGEAARAHGQLVSAGGEEIAGTIDVDSGDGDRSRRVRRFKILVKRLAEHPPGAAKH